MRYIRHNVFYTIVRVAKSHTMFWANLSILLLLKWLMNNFNLNCSNIAFIVLLNLITPKYHLQCSVRWQQQLIQIRSTSPVKSDIWPSFVKYMTMQIKYFLYLFLEKSPGTKASTKMKPIEEGMEDDVFEESAPYKSRRVLSTSSEEVQPTGEEYTTSNA